MPGKGKFRLLAGMHIGPDLTAEPVVVINGNTREPLKDKDGNVVTKYPSRTYKAGDVVVADQDLTTIHGWQKFERLSGEFVTRSATGNPTPGDPSPRSVAKDSTQAPHGQVSTGWPAALPDSSAPVREGKMD